MPIDLAQDARWICPDHHQPLQPRGSTLFCAAGHDYRVLRGIPRFVAPNNYAAAFGEQWQRYPRTQLDSYTGLPITEDRLRRCIGMPLGMLAGQNVLECGCGAGRFTEVLLKHGAYTTSVDLSTAVDANLENFPLGDRHCIAQADILHLPFEPQQFDVVICLGVIQHTPDPEQTMQALYSQVRPGGLLVIDHYTHEKGRWTSLKPLFRFIMRRLKPEHGLRWTERLVSAFLPLHKRFKGFYPAWFLLCRVSPITTFYRSFPHLPDQLQREWAQLDTHDSLTDWYKHLRTPEQIRKSLGSLGLESIECWAGGNGVEARGRRPR